MTGVSAALATQERHPFAQARSRRVGSWSFTPLPILREAAKCLQVGRPATGVAPQVEQLPWSRGGRQR
ncbi:hypothetical protein [Dendronalium sp. ChiSLP03b]|uniref:hypothetical protein n=1 Tax=Dendronalium sp. ChiSLP03b TaxID=3075381 RepID=UPI002ADB975B|nr:hypothetical protein [Dendronalium sp. ChiSLP03b]